MKKVAVLTDSTCCLPSELVEKYGIYVVPLLIIYEGKTYRDGLDISPADVYRIMRRRKNLPTTSTASAGDILDAFRRISQEAESILCITLTSLQSQVYRTALLARDLAKDELPNTTIEVIDSRAVAGSLGFIVREAAIVASQGGDLTQAAEAARNMMTRVNFLAMLDTLYFLARTGRIAKAAAWAGSLISIKPILEHNPAVGETMPVARPRTREKAIEQMLEIMKDRVGNRTVHVIVHHTDEPEQGEKLKGTIKERFSCSEAYLTEFTPIMGVHTGPGVIAVSFYTD